jgi:hypothetical protein
MTDVSTLTERVTDLTQASVRAALVAQLLDHLDSANAIQQQLLADTFPEMCYEFHDEIENLADRIEHFLED